MADRASYLADLARTGLGQGLALSYGDEAEAALRARLNGTKYEDELRAIRAKIAAFQEANPKAASAAEMGGSVLPMLIPFVGPAARAASLGRIAAQEGAINAIAGFGAGETREDRMLQAALGGVTGAALGAGMAKYGPRLLGLLRKYKTSLAAAGAGASTASTGRK